MSKEAMESNIKPDRAVVLTSSKIPSSKVATLGSMNSIGCPDPIHTVARPVLVAGWWGHLVAILGEDKIAHAQFPKEGLDGVAINVLIEITPNNDLLSIPDTLLDLLLEVLQ